MSSDSPQPEQPAAQSQSSPAPPQTLTDFQQQFAATVLANMKASNEALLDAVQQQQARMEAATTELMQRFGWPVSSASQQPITGSHQQPGESGQPAAGQTPPAQAGPT